MHKEGLVPLFTLATALNFLLSPLSALMPYFVVYDHMGDASALALVVTSLQGGLLAGGLMMSMLKDLKRKITLSLAFVFAVFLGYVVVALAPIGSFWLLAAAVAVMGFAIAPANVLITTVIQTIVPLDMMGRVDSASSSISSAASPIGFLLSGAIVGFIGTNNMFLACAIAGMATVALSLLLTNVSSLDQPPQQTEAKGT
jgi:DHA3 family macrolide efflux protein-like MFS transporter